VVSVVVVVDDDDDNVITALLKVELVTPPEISI